MLKRDAFIYNMNQSKEGKEYLNNAWRLNETAPDKKSLREAFGKED